MEENKKYKIFLSPPHQSGQEKEYLQKVLDSNWLAPGGEFVHQFEEKLKITTNRNFCVALNSGTAAIHLALKTLGVGNGDLVICQAFSFIATANPIAYQGAIPVFVDCEKESWNIDPVLLEKAIKDLAKNGQKPKAIIYTHIYGNPAKVADILFLGEKYDIPIIEDAAEALGSKIGGKSVGRFGDISIISFNGNKVITTAGGGALLTDNPEWANRVRALASQARNPTKQYTHDEIGFNYQMSNLSAALGLAQIPYLVEWVDLKRSIFENYKDYLKQNSEFKSVEEEVGGSFSNRWLSVFLAPSPIVRRNIISSLKKNGIECRRFWKPLHLIGIYQQQFSYISGVASMLFENGFCLPSGVGLKNEEQKMIKDIIGSLE